jgi:hypothetical protein
LLDPRPAGGRQTPTEDRLQALALYILEERERRQWHFPRAVFDEIPWETLLLLYASEPVPLSKAELVKAMSAAPDVVDRWADYLEREALLTKLAGIEGAPALKLTRAGLRSLKLYLFDRLTRADATERGRREIEGASLSIWGVGLLMLGTAVLSVVTTWSLVG